MMENYTKQELDEKFKELALLFRATRDMLSSHDTIIRSLENSIKNSKDEDLKNNFLKEMDTIAKEKNKLRNIAGNQFFA
jgi:hypothetical protein